MKDLVRDVVPTPAYLVPSGVEAAVAFGESSGWPIVVKPRLGYGSRGITIVRSAHEVRREVALRPGNDVLLEEFVDGNMYHIDGFMDDGSIIMSLPSRYLNGCLAFQEGLPLGSAQLDPGDPLVPVLDSVAAHVIAALPPTSLTPFHLELFVDRTSGSPVFCEIAARLGGTHVFETLSYSTGVNPNAT